jgi:hypothetical protein
LLRSYLIKYATREPRFEATQGVLLLAALRDFIGQQQGACRVQKKNPGMFQLKSNPSLHWDDFESDNFAWQLIFSATKPVVAEVEMEIRIARDELTK